VYRGRAIRGGPDFRWSASLNRHRIWPGCKNGLLKEVSAGGLKALCQRAAVTARQRMPGLAWLYLELRRRPMGRENARPQPPAASRRYGGGTEEPAPVPVGVTGHRPPNPAAQGAAKLDPPDPGPRHPPAAQPAQPSQLPHWTQGANGGQYRRLWPLSRGPSDRTAGLSQPLHFSHYIANLHDCEQHYHHRLLTPTPSKLQHLLRPSTWLPRWRSRSTPCTPVHMTSPLARYGLSARLASAGCSVPV
jgi:hypothetical protein